MNLVIFLRNFGGFLSEFHGYSHSALGDMLVLVLFGQAGRFRANQALVLPFDCAM